MQPIGAYVEIKEGTATWYGEVRGYVLGGYKIRVGGTDDRLVEVPADCVEKKPVVVARVLRPFGDIFAEVVKENASASWKTANHIEVFLTTFLGVAGGSGVSEIVDSFNASVFKVKTYEEDDIMGMTVGQFVDEVIALRKGSGSCGASTELLDRLLSSTERSSPMPRIALSDLLVRLRSCVVGHWYCRITRNPHSFFIECIGDEGYVWQSYFGQYMLAETLLTRRRRPITEVLDLLEAAMASHQNEAQQQLFQHRFDWNDGTKPVLVEHYLNTQPAGAATAKKALLRALQLSWQTEWGGGEALAKPMRAVLLSEKRDKSAPFALEHPELWDAKLIGFNFDDIPEEVQKRLDTGARLDVGTVVGTLMIYEGNRQYKVIGHAGEQGHRLQRVD